VFLAWRAHNRKGDARFDDVKHQPAMFFVYWMVQAIWVYTISLPLMVEQSARNQSSVTGLLDWSLLFGFAVSIALEVVSDIQKTMWIERGRPGGFCAEGLWKYSRHPNYAGEIFQWIFCSAFAALSGFPYWIVGLLSPLFTLQILLNTSGTGIWNAEGKNLRRHYESENASQYEEYRRTTSPLIPLVGYEFVPLWIKRNVLFEYSKYEYDPDKVRREKKE
jgi:steroid 5-alpha reductase family enzyme